MSLPHYWRGHSPCGIQVYHNQCKIDIWQNLKEISTFLVGIESPLLQAALESLPIFKTIFQNFSISVSLIKGRGDIGSSHPYIHTISLHFAYSYLLSLAYYLFIYFVRGVEISWVVAYFGSRNLCNCNVYCQNNWL